VSYESVTLNRSHRLLLVPGIVSLCAAFVACSSDDTNAPYDAGSLPDVDTHADGGHDATGDATNPDGGVDATGDATSDGGADAANDATTDAGRDGGDAAGEAGNDASDAAFVPPTCDGVIGAGEYGVHTDGQNQQTTSTSQTWYVTWDDASLYVGIAGANTGEAAVLYVSSAPSIAVDAGTAANGTTVGFGYDNETVALLPMHTQLVGYVKQSYNETRTADGAFGWSSPLASALTVCNSGTTREFSIPWSRVTGGARPASFGWLGLLTSGGGFVYGQVPSDNTGGQIGTTTVYPFYYLVANATPVTGDKPFANKLSR
jgi:hypothetical protein